MDIRHIYLWIFGIFIYRYSAYLSTDIRHIYLWLFGIFIYGYSAYFIHGYSAYFIYGYSAYLGKPDMIRGEVYGWSEFFLNCLNKKIDKPEFFLLLFI